MINGASFQTKARTVDHLGREQIADTPTAISELWKNAFDAYARSVELNIYDGPQPIAAIVDDGHGMNREEFVNRWLVVGTESKATADRTPIEDRHGLPVRPRQGQKGIGRLSCANLGPILFFVSKREKSDFVAALVDWRLFENPFLNLSDIFIPVVEFSGKNQLFSLLPGLKMKLLENITGGDDKHRKLRIQQAWSAYDSLSMESAQGESATRPKPPSREITSTIESLKLEERHLQQWQVWNAKKTHGTALLVANINYDLSIQLESMVPDIAARQAQKRLFETLSSFVDPFVDPAHPELNAIDPQFTYAVKVWKGQNEELILGSEKQFDRHMIEPMEHCIDGSVDADGNFRGRIKAFGQWVQEECVIEAPKDLVIPRRLDTAVGPFSLFIASMEFKALNTTHTKAEWERFQDLAEMYAGFLMFRDGLRVMPYGRADNDFFEIESRRSRSAGREFWNHRQMFGRLAIRRARNPNLKDKAGREGLLDNRAAKTLKALVSNILMQSARRYFGSASELRTELLPQIIERNEKERAAEARNKLKKKQRKEFRKKLEQYSKELPGFQQEVAAYSQTLKLVSEDDISEAQSAVERFQGHLTEFRLPGAPSTLGSLESMYLEFREDMRAVQSTISSLSEFVDQEIERLKPAKPRELLEKQLARNAAQLHRRIQVWKKSIDSLQRAEAERVRELVAQRNKIFHGEAAPLLHRVEAGELSFAEASKTMELLKRKLDAENEELFVPYIGALESLKESIDLEHLAVFGMDELNDLRGELERLNGLAQLGIAVEIVGHELQSYDEIIGSGLKRLPEDIRQGKAAKDIEFGYEGLTDQLRFLSPLRLAGQRIQKWISGEEIYKYLSDFFKITLSNNKIEFTASEDFRNFRVYDQQSRLYPVFINLLNNSIYWLSLKDTQRRRIVLDVVKQEIVVSDNGPGVASEDVNSLFSLFFTKKLRGGRGVGLYLSRANLAAGGHRIRYEADAGAMPLSGANFAIEFRGAEFNAD